MILEIAHTTIAIDKWPTVTKVMRPKLETRLEAAESNLNPCLSERSDSKEDANQIVAHVYLADKVDADAAVAH